MQYKSKNSNIHAEGGGGEKKAGVKRVRCCKVGVDPRGRKCTSDLSGGKSGVPGAVGDSSNAVPRSYKTGVVFNLAVKEATMGRI